MRFLASARSCWKSPMRESLAVSPDQDNGAATPRDSGERGHDARRRLHRVAHRYARRGVRGQIEGDLRAEADESIALPARQAIAGSDVAQDAPRNQSGDLH